MSVLLPRIGPGHLADLLNQRRSTRAFTPASLVFIEGAVDEHFLEETDEIERYTLRFDRIRAVAHTAEESAARLRDNRLSEGP